MKSEVKGLQFLVNSKNYSLIDKVNARFYQKS